MGMLPDFVGPAAEPFDLRFVDGDGRRHDTARLLLVSNNPYLVVRPRQRGGTRGTLDAGVLGIIAIRHTACRRGPPLRFASTPQTASPLASTARAFRWNHRSSSSPFLER
jgi:hypothetical protein